jgi:glycosyltransferase involved in cell wall biosynthesis
MKVLLFSDVQRKGGAGIAAHRLACTLIEQGHEVRWATPFPDPVSDIPTINCRELPATGRAARRIALALQPGKKQAVESRAVTRRLLQIIRDYRPDVVNIHNLHGAALHATLPAELSRKAPVIWTLHDMWAFTGTCAYAMDCRKFESACDNSCPMADEYPASPASLVAPQFDQRLRALKNAGRIAFATPSRWLAEEAQRGMLNPFEVRAIPNSVELDKFRPIDRDAARQSLDLPMGRPVFVTAATQGDPRKGASVLYDAMTKLNRPNTILLQLGGAAPEGVQRHWDHRVLSGIHDPRLMRLAYSASEAHILPTLADNLPNTLLEAAACGVPSIGSDVGGVGEAIEVGKTGWLVPPGDADALAARIGRVIDEATQTADERRRMCRVFAVSNFTPAVQARRYVELYNDTMQQTGTRTRVIGNIRRYGREAA